MGLRKVLDFHESLRPIVIRIIVRIIVKNFANHGLAQLLRRVLLVDGCAYVGLGFKVLVVLWGADLLNFFVGLLSPVTILYEVIILLSMLIYHGI